MYGTSKSGNILYDVTYCTFYYIFLFVVCYAFSFIIFMVQVLYQLMSRKRLDSVSSLSQIGAGIRIFYEASLESTNSSHL